MKVVIIDNYDSFTFNLYQYCGEILNKKTLSGQNEIIVKRNDEITVKNLENFNPDKIIISPGPGSPDKKEYFGEYLFTIDWCHPESNILDTEHSEIPHEHKCGHVLALDNGNFAIQPNNRILWNISNFTTRNDIPDYKVQTTEWNVENKDFVTEDSDKMFYKIEDK